MLVEVKVMTSPAEGMSARLIVPVNPLIDVTVIVYVARVLGAMGDVTGLTDTLKSTPMFTATEML